MPVGPYGKGAPQMFGAELVEGRVNFLAPLYVYGSPVASAYGLEGGKVFYVDGADGDDTQDGLTPATALKTILAAYNKCTANNNDTVVLIGNNGSHTLSAALTWAKDYTHLVGICSPTKAGKRARIFQLSTLTGASPLINITASGCVFSNFRVFQGVDDATSLIAVQVTGDRNYFENVEIIGGGHASHSIDGGASLKLDGAYENTFVGCTFGGDTITTGTGFAVALFDSESSRNYFLGCFFTLWGGHAGTIFCEVVDGTGIDRYTIFKDCVFSNTGTTMTQAFAIPAGISGPRKMLLVNSFMHGATDWDANDRGVLLLSAGTITGGGNSGILAASAAT